MKSIEVLRSVRNYSLTFNVLPPTDKFHFIKNTSVKLILIKLAHINAVLSSINIDDHDKYIFENILFRGIDYSKLFSSNSISYFDLHQIFFSAASISNLIKDIMIRLYHEDEKIDLEKIDKKEDIKNSINLFKTILIYNEYYFKVKSVNKPLTTFKELFTLSAIQQNYIRNATPLPSIIKFLFIRKFIITNNKLSDWTKIYIQNYGIGTLSNFANFILNISMNNLVPQFSFNKNQFPTKLLKELIFKKKNKFKNNEISLNFDLIPKPFIEIDNSRIILLDTNFLNFQIDQGFFHNFHKNISTYSEFEFKEADKFNSYLGLEYFEKYLCKSILEKIFSVDNIYSDINFQDFIIKIDPDNILIIECKMAQINAKTIEDLDFDQFKQEVKRNLCSVNTTGAKRKGAYQLTKQIERLTLIDDSSEIAQKLKIKKVKRLNVFPIILTSEENYNILGTNNFLNNEIEHEINRVKVNFQNVYPILILNISTLINYYGYFKKSKRNFTNLAKEYHKEIKKNTRLIQSSNEKIYYIESSMSFHLYSNLKLKNHSLKEMLDPFINDFRDELK